MRKKPDERKSDPTAGSPPVDKATWGESLKMARTAMGLSLKDAADTVGITKAYWLLCERGERTPSASVAAFMAMVVRLDDDKADAGVGIALGSRFDSKGAADWERLIIASIAAAGLEVEMTSNPNDRTDIKVTLPNGKVVGVEFKITR
jgi:transcriptional regulator with XRE-family HTH domain